MCKGVVCVIIKGMNLEPSTRIAFALKGSCGMQTAEMRAVMVGATRMAAKYLALNATKRLMQSFATNTVNIRAAYKRSFIAFHTLIR